MLFFILSPWEGRLPDGATTQLISHLRKCKDGMHQAVWRQTKFYQKKPELGMDPAVPGSAASDKKQLRIGEPQEKWNPKHLRKLLTNWVASSDRAFIELENPWLLSAFEYANPNSLLALKTGNTVKADIKRNYEEHQAEMILELKVILLTHA